MKQWRLSRKFDQYNPNFADTLSLRSTGRLVIPEKMAAEPRPPRGQTYHAGNQGSPIQRISTNQGSPVTPKIVKAPPAAVKPFPQVAEPVAPPKPTEPMLGDELILLSPAEQLIYHQELEALKPGLDAAKIAHEKAKLYFQKWNCVSFLEAFISRMETQLDQVIQAQVSNPPFQKVLKNESFEHKRHLNALKKNMKTPEQKREYMNLVKQEIADKQALLAVLEPGLVKSTKVCPFLKSGIKILTNEAEILNKMNLS